MLQMVLSYNGKNRSWIYICGKDSTLQRKGSMSRTKDSRCYNVKNFARFYIAEWMYNASNYVDRKIYILRNS